MPTYTQIGSAVVVGSGGAATIDFNSIPATYTDLLIKVSARSDQVNVVRSFNVKPNGTNITARRLGAEGNPFAVYSDTTVSLYIPGTDATANTFGNTEIYIPNYTSSTTNKSLSIDASSENNATSAGLSFTAGLYSSITAITSVSLSINLGLFTEHSTAYLYGVSNA
jgi:hypothetical protein